MIKVRTQNNIKDRYFIKEDNIYHVGKDSCFYENDLKILDGKYSIRTVSKSEVWLFDDKNIRTIIFDSSTKQFKGLEYAIYKLGNFSEEIEVCLIAKDDKDFYGKIDRTTKSILEEYPVSYGISQIVNDKIFLSKKKNFIAITYFENGVQLWKKEFNDLLQGTQVRSYGNIVVQEGVIYIYLADLDNRSNTSTFCINAVDGRVIKQISNFFGNLFLFNDLIGVANLYTVCILNTKTLEIEEYNVEALLAPHDLRIHWSKAVFGKDGFLYFVDGNFYTTNRFGIIDLKGHKLLWHGSVEVNDGINDSIQKIEVEGDYLHVLDSAKVLHIFDKKGIGSSIVGSSTEKSM